MTERLKAATEEMGIVQQRNDHLRTQNERLLRDKTSADQARQRAERRADDTGGRGGGVGGMAVAELQAALRDIEGTHDLRRQVDTLKDENNGLRREAEVVQTQTISQLESRVRELQERASAAEGETAMAQKRARELDRALRGAAANKRGPGGGSHLGAGKKEREMERMRLRVSE